MRAGSQITYSRPLAGAGQLSTTHSARRNDEVRLALVLVSLTYPFKGRCDVEPWMKIGSSLSF